MNIINIIDNISQVNFGIWNAAIATAKQLKELFQVESELWFPEVKECPELEHVTMVPLKDTSIEAIEVLLTKRELNALDTIIVTHGCWQYATKWGAELKKKGFRWIYTPHGMLEPWSMQQKKWKKKIYYSLIEGPLTKKADFVRAVGTPELKNLQKKYTNTILIPNGIDAYTMQEKEYTKPVQFLFMARLHHKKGILPLVQAWISSTLNNNANYILQIAGPDDGEKETMLKLIKDSKTQNIHYLGPQYGEEKDELLRNSHFYILPSYSEGFPTSVLEAMQYGLIPIITEGCNFPEVFEDQKAIQITPETTSIIEGLEKVKQIHPENFQRMSTEANQYINKNYTLSKIATMQYELYFRILGY